MNRRRIKQSRAVIATGLSLLALAAMGDPARAQNALDNNLQVGTGGVNRTQAPTDYAARNNLITGNVAGLGAFRGNVGYRAPGEFSGTTASDSLFRFNAQSYPTVQGNRPLTQTPSISVFRSEAPTLAGQVSQITPSNPVILPRMAAPGVWSAQSLDKSRYESLTNRSLLGTVQQAEGRLLELSATPLLGLRADDVKRPGEADPRNPNNRDQNLPPGQNEREPSRRIDDANREPAADPNADRPLGQFNPSLTLGEQIDNQVTAGRPTDASMGLDQTIARLQAELFSPLGSSSAAPGEDAYVDLLRRIQRNRDVASGRPVEPLTPPAPGANDPGKAGKPAGAETPDGAGSPGGAPASPNAAGSPSYAEYAAAMPAPAAQELETARLARVNALRAARGLPAELPAATPDAAPTGSKSGTPGAAAPGKQLPPDNAPIPGRLGDLVGTLSYNLPPVATLAGQRANKVNQLLRDAEVDIATGRYFDAEAKYRQAQTISPDQPLITIGLVHAQIGAGLVRSAALNLRTALERHPELIATRYDARLLPKADRFERAAKDLKEMTRTTGRAEPPVLLAYMGYQVNQPALVRLGLDQAQAVAPTDPLLVLLRRIWLTDRPATQPAKEPAKPASSSTPAPAPAPPETNK